MTPDGSQTPGSALAPVRERYAAWLGMDRSEVLADRAEDPNGVRAIQIVLRMERDDPPDWYAAVGAAARGCAAICVDARSEPGGDWYDDVRSYARGHIRKITRRARGSHWREAGDVPGITVASAGAEVRVLVPGPVVELDKRISRLQVGGTDAQRVEPPSRPPIRPGTLVLHPNPLVPMSLGKTMAQAGHAGMIGAALLAGERPTDLRRWIADDFPVAVRPVDDAAWRSLADRAGAPAEAWRTEGLLAVRDAGFTEIDPGTVTVIARWIGPAAGA